MVSVQSTPVVTLHIGTNQTTVTRVMDGAADIQVVLKLGSVKTAKDFFKHAPPTPLELENAIMAVEDEVMLARSLATQPCSLRGTDSSLRGITLPAGASARYSMQLSAEDVEQQFDLLAALIMGRPAPSAGVPVDSGFAAALLILREFMHHLKFSQISIEPSSAQ